MKDIIKLSVSILLLLLLFVYIPFNEVFEVIKGTIQGYYLLAILFCIIAVVIQSYKWNYINKQLGLYIDIKQIIRINFSSYFFGIFTPGKLGADVYKVIELNKFIGTNKSQSFSSVIIEKISTLLAIVVIGGIAVNYLSFAEYVNLFIINIVLFLWFIFLLLIVVCRNKLISLLSKLYGAEKKRVQNKVIKGLLTMLKLKDFNKTNIILLFYSLVFQLIASIAVVFCALALGININYFILTMVFAVTTFLTMLPITISGIGLREGSYVLLLSSFGVDAPLALSLSLLVFSTAVFIAIFGLLFTLLPRTQ